MKIEKLNDNQIKCTLSRQDLDEKDIRISELAYGTDKARELFRDLLEQASIEVDFEVNESPLMIEAVPTGKDSLILIVTKVDNPDELDSRFSRFTHLSAEDDIDEIEDYEDEEDDELNAAVDDLLNINDIDITGLSKKAKKADSEEDDIFKDAEKAAAGEKTEKAPAGNEPAGKDEDTLSSIRDQIREGLSGLISSIAKSAMDMTGAGDGTGNTHIEGEITIKAPSPANKPQQDESENEIPFDVFIFKNISDVITAAKELSRIYFSDNTLYKDESSGRFYLYTTRSSNSLEDYIRTQQILVRYSVKCRTTYASISYYNEHFKVIRRKNALQLLATI